jgi:hypothetical protein
MAPERAAAGSGARGYGPRATSRPARGRRRPRRRSAAAPLPDGALEDRRARGCAADVLGACSAGRRVGGRRRRGRSAGGDLARARGSLPRRRGARAPSARARSSWRRGSRPDGGPRGRSASGRACQRRTRAHREGEREGAALPVGVEDRARSRSGAIGPEAVRAAEVRGRRSGRSLRVAEADADHRRRG